MVEELSNQIDPENDPIIYPGKNGETDKITDVYTHVNAVHKHYQTIGLVEDI